MNNRKNITINTTYLSLIVFVIFVVLKITNIIDWSWLWITSPLWINLGVGLIIYIAVIFWYKRQIRMMKKWGEKFDNQRFTW